MTLLQRLETLPLARKMSYSQLQHFSKYCQVLTYEKGETLYSPKQPFEYIGIIIEGKVSYYLHGPEFKRAIRLASYKRYPVGMINFLQQKESSITVKAAESTEIIAIRYTDLEKLEQVLPRVTALLYKALLRLQLQINGRLANILIKKFGQKTKGH